MENGKIIKGKISQHRKCFSPMIFPLMILPYAFSVYSRELAL